MPSTQVKHRRGTTSQCQAFAGALAEFVYDTTLKTIRICDGQQMGGFVVLRLNADGTLTIGGTTISADGATLNFTHGEANTRIVNGQLQVFDPVAFANNATKPWRIIGCQDGALITSDPTA